MVDSKAHAAQTVSFVGIILVVPEILYSQTLSFIALPVLKTFTVRDLVFQFKTLFLVKNPSSLKG